MGSDALLLAIDVGTTSARAAVFDCEGKKLAYNSAPFTTWNELPDMYEQSSEEIWSAVCRASRSVCADYAERVCGIGFDATCSLVVLDENNKPISVALSGEDERNVILWMDHRAVEEAEYLSKHSDPCIKRIASHYGGKVSPENEIPKIMWLKKHIPATWKRVHKLMDLSDFLSFRATGDESRGVCATACKWGRVDREGWDTTFLEKIGLEEACADNCRLIGSRVLLPGQPLELQLSEKSCEELGGLNRAKVKVASSLVDAHAGGVGMLGSFGHPLLDKYSLYERLAVISGTSTCHLVLSKDPVFVPGVWGPFPDALGPILWLTEGGQSATGALLDHVIDSHARRSDLDRLAERSSKSRYFIIEEIASQISPESAAHMHVLPYFHGNRHPRSDPSLRGAISGLRLGSQLADLAAQYLATLEAIVYGARHLLEELNTAGHSIKVLLLCGGGAKSELFIRTLTDATQMPVFLTQEPEAVLLGDAINAATACGAVGNHNIEESMKKMSQATKCYEPDRRRQRYHDAKYKVFLEMYDDFMRYRQTMNEALQGQ
mmetsp:Transcript_302/g.987  ORF Transcript_302/g.987 Transcript_302/m.987 type:complete len:549 (-) Transcript_302:2711-4357(-)